MTPRYTTPEGSEKSPFFTPRRLIAALATVVALSGAAKFGPDALDELWELTTDPSLIVAGVPGQVEDYSDRRVWTGKFFVHKYWLEIEQCPADIVAAQEGDQTSSFDPQVGVRDPACNVDWVRVSDDTYGSATVGGTLVFSGEVGEPLRK